MKLLLSVVLLFCIISAITALKPGQCYDDKNKLKLEDGDEVKNPSRECSKITCKNGIASTHFCKDPKPKAGCRVGDYVDQKAEFPDCCSRVLNC